MIQRNEDDIAVSADVLTIVAVLLDTVSRCEPATVDPYENGALVAVKARSPNVETETILDRKSVV